MKLSIRLAATVALFAGALLCANAQNTADASASTDSQPTAMASNDSQSAMAANNGQSAMTSDQCKCSTGSCTECKCCGCHKHFYVSAGGGYLFKSKNFNGGGMASARAGWVFAKKYGWHALEVEINGAWTKGSSTLNTAFTSNSTDYTYNSQLNAKLDQYLLMFNYRFTTKLGGKCSPWMLTMGGGIGPDFTHIKITQANSIVNATSLPSTSNTKNKAYFAGQLFAGVGYVFKVSEFPVWITAGARVVFTQKIKATGTQGATAGGEVVAAAPQAQTNVANGIVEGTIGFAF